MSILSRYFDYLSHFGNTSTLIDFAKHSRPAIALRHDVDHCIDTALEMAFWESETGISATYLILDTAPYIDDPRLLDKCRQIQNFGHEIGIHNNVLTQWYQSKIDPFETLKLRIKDYRDAGIKIFGTSAHGDPGCYENHYINYWVFNELKPDDPESRESSLNAEGIFEPDAKKRIHYPRQHCLSSTDGRKFLLWSITQKSLGLLYEASHLKADAYYTDSGGSWHRSPDPLQEELDGKRIQILMHPIHWKAPRRIYFFLSTVCSGSRDLALVLDQATSCNGYHEVTLSGSTTVCNGEKDAQNLLELDARKLLQEKRHAEKYLDATRRFVDQQDVDFAETSEHLPSFAESLVEKFPDANFVLLYRPPGDIVHSILRNGLTRDLIVDSGKASQKHADEVLSPFDKSCNYVGITLRSMLEFCNIYLSYEKLITDGNYLKNKLKDLGIAYYPLLGGGLLKNSNKPGLLTRMSFLDRRKYSSTEVYQEQLATLSDQFMEKSRWRRRLLRIKQLLNPDAPDETRPRACSASTDILWQAALNQQFVAQIAIKNSSVDLVGEKLEVLVDDPASHAYVILKGGDWDLLNSGMGWPMRYRGYYTWAVKASVPNSLVIKMFCLFYDNHGKLIDKFSFGALNEGEVSKEVCFAAAGNAKYFNLALYTPKHEQTAKVYLRASCLKFITY